MSSKNEIALCGIILIERLRAERMSRHIAGVLLTVMVALSASLGSQDFFDGYGWHDIAWLTTLLCTYLCSRLLLMSHRNIQRIDRAKSVIDKYINGEEFRAEDLEAAMSEALPGVRIHCEME